ncbi:MAG: aminotransferase class I/II-fold pyridoxal phosphate-dependent enzyme [Tetrasphaera sp.]
MERETGLRPATAVVSAGRPEPRPGAPVNPPVTFASTFAADGDYVYGRSENPTWEPVEEILGALEGGEALLFASGMAAVAAAVDLVGHGATVVAPAGPYNGVHECLTEAADSGRFTVRWVDAADTAATIAALDGAHLLWLESPTNPLLELADIPALAPAARERGLIVICDNTFATPLLQRPLRDGVDVVVHSVSKYLAGHSAIVLGACVTAPTERGRELQAHLVRSRRLGGAIPGPMEAWLAALGIRTLAVRLERATRTAAVLAARLGRHPAVERVRYPGFGAIISIEVAGGADAADRACAAARLISRSTSLGGVETQWERRRRYPSEPHTTPDNLVRISVGIEDCEDLWADLARALDKRLAD